MSLAQERGASSWLSTLPINEHGFTLHKGAFRDALALRYGWQPSNLPSNCVCGAHFSVEHALSCAKGGFPTLRHNEVRDIAAQLLSEVCTEVRIEPRLQPLSGEQIHLASANREDNARLDISANGLWGGQQERSMFDVRVFNPYAPSMTKEPQRVLEHASFSPFVLTEPDPSVVRGSVKSNMHPSLLWCSHSNFFFFVGQNIIQE